MYSHRTILATLPLSLESIYEFVALGSSSQPIYHAVIYLSLTFIYIFHEHLAHKRRKAVDKGCIRN